MTTLVTQSVRLFLLCCLCSAPCFGQLQNAAGKGEIIHEEVRYRSGEITLAGTLTRPSTQGPHPALVLITGSGRALRDQFGTYPDTYASMGIATLVYDKRGCGASTGRFHDLLPIEELAADVVAGIEFLQSRSEIDPTRIGLVAASQGGWVAPLAASRSKVVSLIVLISAPTLSVADNGLYEIDNDLRREGFSEREVAEARRLNRLFNEMVIKRGAGWSNLRLSLETARNEMWFDSARLPGPLPEIPAPANLRWVEMVRQYIDFDPMPLWEKTTIPVLAFYGGSDVNVPGRESSAMLRQALKKAGNRDFTIKFYTQADHHLKIANAANPTSRKGIPEVEKLVFGWPRERMKIAR